MLLTLMMQIGMLGERPTAGGEPFEPRSHVYLSWSYEDELKHQRELAAHANIVREAAVEATTHNYYAPEKLVDDEAIRKLESMARDLEVKITENDLILLDLELKQIRAVRDFNRKKRNKADEEAILLLL